MRPIFITAFLLGSAATASEPSAQIELWTRAAGSHGDQRVAHNRPVTIDLDRVALTEGPLVDVQYGGTRTVRYVAIVDLIRRYGPPPEVDTALLHFSNGMAIPLAFRDPEVMRRLAPAVVRAIKLDGKWTTGLPPVTRTDELYFDVRPLTFQGNKLAVADRWHPALRTGTDSQFSPWRYADSLAGIEFVNDSAFLAQFAGDPSVKSGATTYGQVCRFCHGARKEGAQFGWDFVEPIPISEYRKKDASLYYHVKCRAVDAVSRGLLMPGLPYLTAKDASDLLAWLRVLAHRPLSLYDPSR
jgi:hypothetical protein